MRSAGSDCPNAPDRLKIWLIGCTSTNVPTVRGQPNKTRTLKNRSYASLSLVALLTK